jgi:hypothetical protein
MVSAGDYKQDAEHTARMTKTFFERNKGPIILLGAVGLGLYGKFFTFFHIKKYVSNKKQ